MLYRRQLVILAALGLLCTLALAGCPFGFDKPNVREKIRSNTMQNVGDEDYIHAALNLDWDAVVADIKALFAGSFPDILRADSMLDGTTSYGPFFIRQAWHCTGSYRQTDGLGGCAGGRQRFNPELSWPDNTNLDKGKRLMWPIKEKYGLGLSWGDLIVLGGKVAIEEGGGPLMGFCAGRPDQIDGSQSALMGPTSAQEKIIPCTVDGDCGSPFGADTIGLIYVNPNGFMGDYKRLDTTAKQINETFGHMSMDAEETVALIGGGHSFGKTHGACMINRTAFLSPEQDPQDPWPVNTCPNGTFTTGFEGYWTSTPKMWGNQFFNRLVNMPFEARMAAGGNYQYQSSMAEDNKMMLPSDISLLHDPLYTAYANAFANNKSYLTEVFQKAWYKLTTRDMGPIERCLNISIGGVPQLSPPQAFQFPLPPAPSPLPNFANVAKLVRSVLYSGAIDKFATDSVGGKPYWGAVFTHLAFQCAATYRDTDHLGGCNGARIRFPPQSDWIFNNGMSEVLALLQSEVQSTFGASLSTSDLIVIAGTVAVEDASGANFSFCGGRSDATEGYPATIFKPTFNFSDIALPFHWNARVWGVTAEELVALSARPRSANQMARMGYSNASWSEIESLNNISNAYFKHLLNENWSQVVGPSGQPEFSNSDSSRFMTLADMRILWHADQKNTAQLFAVDNALFLRHFTSGWTKLMNADRYKNSVASLCA